MVNLLNEIDALKKENASLSVEVNTLRAIVDTMTKRGASEQVIDERQMELAEVVAPAEEVSRSKEEENETAPSIARKSGKKRRIPIADKLKDLPVGKTTYIVPDVVGTRGTSVTQKPDTWVTLICLFQSVMW